MVFEVKTDRCVRDFWVKGLTLDHVCQYIREGVYNERTCVHYKTEGVVSRKSVQQFKIYCNFFCLSGNF